MDERVRDLPFSPGRPGQITRKAVHRPPAIDAVTELPKLLGSQTAKSRSMAENQFVRHESARDIRLLKQA